MRVLSTLNREDLKPNARVALHRSSHSVVDILPADTDAAALGIGVFVDARKLWYQAPFLTPIFIMFGAAVALTGVFSLRPIDEALAYNETSHALHSVFATIAGFSFTIGAIAFGFFEKSRKGKIACFAAAVIATLLSVLMAFLPDFQGLLQRLMFMATFSWLIIFIPSRAL